MATDKKIASINHWQFTHIETERFQNLRIATWTKGNPDCYIVFVSGRSEYIEKYECLPKRFNLPDNYAYLIWDHRGQGDSTGLRGHIDSYEQYANDTSFIINSIVRKKPYIIVAHSMGALISLYATSKGLIKPKSMILCSPLLLLPNHPIPRQFAKIVSNSFKKIGAGHLSTGWIIKGEPEFSGNTLTNSYKGFLKTVHAKYASTPPTMGWVAATFAATEYIFSSKALKKIPCPTLVLGGSDERVVAFEGFSKWVQKARVHLNSTINFQLIHAARHELLNETSKHKSQAIDKIKTWILNTRLR